MMHIKSLTIALTGAAIFISSVRSADTRPEIRKAENAVEKARPAPKSGQEPPLNGEQILRLVRMSQALQDLKHLHGRLRNDETGKDVPMDLTMADGVIRFVFKNPPEIINLDINDNKSELTRVTSGGKVIVPRSLGSENVRETHLNYEDLSMRFLYWPNSVLTGTETVRTRKCWRVRASTPDGRGPYGTVDIWVDQGSGAMMMMEAYDMQGHKVKQFKVISGQKYKGAWILKEMRVEAYDALREGDLKGRTYMEIKDPE